MRDDAPDQPGPAVGGYCIERFIGAGGAATVYEARRLGPNGPEERVACKVLHAQRRNRWHRELLRREAVLGLRATPGHPNLVEIFDFFDDAEAQLCIVMELVDGASVAELCAPDRRLPVPVVRRIACEVLEALVYLHERGVLHRDLCGRGRTGGPHRDSHRRRAARWPRRTPRQPPPGTAPWPASRAGAPPTRCPNDSRPAGEPW